MNRITRGEIGEETESEARALVQILTVAVNKNINIGKSWKEDFLESIVIVLTNHPVSPYL